MCMIKRSIGFEVDGVSPPLEYVPFIAQKDTDDLKNFNVSDGYCVYNEAKKCLYV